LDILDENSDYFGSYSLQNRKYAEYIRELARKGFEIAFHGASMESSPRDIIVESLKQFKAILGFSPRTYACHAGNRENIFWGEHRFYFSVFKLWYRLLNSNAKNYFSGHDPKSVYYWADICGETFDYVRTFTFNDINLLNIGRMPYLMKDRLCFKSSFYTCFADNVEEFNRLLSIENQIKLQKEKGVCILTTHFGKGFVKDGELNKKTKYLLSKIAKRNGYFAPVCEVLDYLMKVNGNCILSKKEIFYLEFRWFIDTFQRKLKKLDYEKTELKYLGSE
jgi:hypothetical protein